MPVCLQSVVTVKQTGVFSISFTDPSNFNVQSESPVFTLIHSNDNYDTTLVTGLGTSCPQEKRFTQRERVKKPSGLP